MNTFAFCEKVQLVGQRIFDLPRAGEAESRAHRLEKFLCLDPDCGEEELRKRALFLQVIKYLFEICKNARRPESDFQLLDMARLLLYRATKGKRGKEDRGWPQPPAHPRQGEGGRGRRRPPPSEGSAAQDALRRRRGEGRLEGNGNLQ